MPFLARRPSEATLRRLHAQAVERDVTYHPAGATRVRLRRKGFVSERHERRIGMGEGAFAGAVAALRSWEAHRRAGLGVYPDGASLETGTTVLVLARLAVVHMVAPCRIVYSVDEPDRFGFAYGTLPGHPETGEEVFLVERRRDGVYFVIAVFARTAHPLARLGGPVSWRVQRAYTARYLSGLAAAVSETTH